MPISRSQIQKLRILARHSFSEEVWVEYRFLEERNDFIFCARVVEPNRALVGGVCGVIMEFEGVEVIPAVEDRVSAFDNLRW